MKTKQAEALEAVDAILNNQRRGTRDMQNLNLAVATLENFIHLAGQASDLDALFAEKEKVRLLREYGIAILRTADREG